ncbi:MAG: class II aldolase/adducin family protein, partial [Ilumatobacteraceae bacterium]|nr:class II aldolase/adducin family protein [Ilumatobacteraceae bacterium]
MTPSPDALLPPIGPRQELVLLARTLLLEGYNDHLAGHITYKQPDGTFLVNPWPLVWDEFGPDDVIAMNEHGEKLSGAWQVPLGIPLHVALHQLRPDVVVSVHNHPLYATTYANAKRVPPPYDQSSALGGGTVVLVDEYTTAVNDVNAAQSAAQA